MLQSKGLSSRATEEDHERTRRLADAEMTIHQLEGLLEQKDKEMLQLREVRVCVFVYVYVCHWQRRNNMQSSITMCAGESLCAYPDVNVFTSECIISRQSPWLLPVLSVDFIPVSPLTFLFSLLLLV